MGYVMKNTRLQHYYKFLPKLEEIIAELPESSKVKCELKNLLDLPPMDLVIVFDTDCDFGIENIEELETGFNASITTSGSEIKIAIPVSDNQDEAIQVLLNFFDKAEIRSGREYMHERVGEMIAECVEQAKQWGLGQVDEICRGNQTLDVIYE